MTSTYSTATSSPPAEAVLATGFCGAVCARGRPRGATASMSGGANNYRKGAPVVDQIGEGGFWMWWAPLAAAGDGAPLAGRRPGTWAPRPKGRSTNRKVMARAHRRTGHSVRCPVAHLGQPHGHLAYDSGEFNPSFYVP